MTTTHNTTGAELQTLRESCGMTREEFADLAGVQARTVKHWENGRAGVPADVAGLALQLDTAATAATRHALDVLRRVHLAADAPPADVVLLRYKTNAELRINRSDATKPSPAGDMPASLQGAIVARTRLALALHPDWAALPVRVVWFDGAEYDTWRAAGGVDNSEPLPDTSEARAAWAAAQVAKQAIPHRADQPPA